MLNFLLHLKNFNYSHVSYTLEVILGRMMQWNVHPFCGES